MSELKYQLMLNKDMSWVPCYLKSEADKVIAELKKEKQYAVDNVAEVINGQERELSHQKYKRCLAMALLWLERSENSTDLENELVSRKRCSKWMELAEKFKPNSTAQQGLRKK